MILTKMTNNMMVQNVQETITFYRDLLHFDFVMAVSKEDAVLMELDTTKELRYAMLKSQTIELMFQSAESLREDIPVFSEIKVGASVSFYFEVDDIDAWYERLKARVLIVKDLHLTWYGMKEFYIKDCNGYVLGFSQEI